jgi:hypothetical protein
MFSAEDRLRAPGRATETQLEQWADEVIAASPEAVVPDTLLTKVFTAAVKQFFARYELGDDLVPLLADHVTATEVGTCCVEMLKVADLQLFELTLWGSRIPNDAWKGRDNGPRE